MSTVVVASVLLWRRRDFMYFPTSHFVDDVMFSGLPSPDPETESASMRRVTARKTVLVTSVKGRRRVGVEGVTVGERM